METGSIPDIHKYVVAADVSAIIREHRLSKQIRNFVGSAWALAEADILAEGGDIKQKERVHRLEYKLNQTPIGERLLGLSDQIRESLKSNPEDTRKVLKETLTRRMNR